MAEPSKKSSEMNMFLDSLMNRTENIRKDVCVCCGESALIFRNEISAKEYSISGLCQKCQDSVFGED